MSPALCRACRGEGEAVVPVAHWSGDPQREREMLLPCELCDGTGSVEGDDDE